MVLGRFSPGLGRCFAVAGLAAVCVAFALYSQPGRQSSPYLKVCNASAAIPKAQCGNGKVWEKLQCDDEIKVTKCFDARVTCRLWDVCDCCSPVPLHKCLSPLAGRGFGIDCSSPIDAREECCGDAFTHRRSFQALADLSNQIKEGVSTATATATELSAQAVATASEISSQAAAAASELASNANVQDLADKASEIASTSVETATELAGKIKTTVDSLHDGDESTGLAPETLGI